MMDDEQPTCGKGIAANSVLPRTLSRIMAAVADVLDAHTKSLNPDEENGRIELSAYRTLVDDHRRIAADLDATARRMAGYRDLPVAEHDERALAGAEGVDAFARLLDAERELSDLLRRRVEEDEQMLQGMREWARSLRASET